jgi:predicted dehydrogenase
VEAGRPSVGVVGCGSVATVAHLPALRALGVPVAAVADTDAERAARAARSHGVERRYATSGELLADPAVDVVAVCVPPEHHVEVALAALAAGKHVLLEKPVALDLDDAQRLVSAASGSGCVVRVGFNSRFHRRVRAARELVRSGALGKLEIVRTAMSNPPAAADGGWRDARGLGGGALADLASHHFDLWRFFAGEVEEVSAMTVSGAGDEVAAAAAGTTAAGVLLSSTFSQRTVAAHEVELLGTEGRLALSLYRFAPLEVEPVGASPGGVGNRVRAATAVLRTLPGALARARLGGDFRESYRLEWEHFLRAVGGEGSEEGTLEDGVRALELLLAAAESARTGRALRPSEAPRRLG